MLPVLKPEPVSRLKRLRAYRESKKKHLSVERMQRVNNHALGPRTFSGIQPWDLGPEACKSDLSLELDSKKLELA